MTQYESEITWAVFSAKIKREFKFTNKKIGKFLIKNYLKY